MGRHDMYLEITDQEGQRTVVKAVKMVRVVCRSGHVVDVTRWGSAKIVVTEEPIEKGDHETLSDETPA